MLDVQTELLDNLATRVVVPLIAAPAMGKAEKHLNPQFKIKRIAVIMSAAELAGVQVHIWGDKICSIKEPIKRLYRNHLGTPARQLTGVSKYANVKQRELHH